MNVVGAQNSGLITVNRGLDNVGKAVSDPQGSGKPEDVTLASGAESGSAVKETTVDKNDTVQATKVVTETEQTVGGNIDLHV
ncbi:MAG: hypothetical protein OIF57_14400 [Marinobacterium sp.]|nr:hypothetical protein [Marinobacterium sp.]